MRQETEGRIAVLAAVVIATASMLGFVNAQTAPPAPPLPVAASSVARHPETYYGKYVSLVGAVERRLSSTAFSIDQDVAKSSDYDVLILAPRLAGEVALNTYVTVIGRVVRFDSDDIAEHAAEYPVELGPDATKKFAGRPAVLAVAVIDKNMRDLTKSK